MNRVMKCLALMLMTTIVVGVGCEWESVDEDGGLGGGGVGAGTGGTSAVCGEKEDNGDGTTWVRNEIVAFGDGSSTVFSGTLCFSPLVPGSVTFAAAGFGFNDAGNGTLPGIGESAGTVSYNSAGWTLDFKDAAVDDGQAIVASYVFGISTNQTTTTIGAGTGTGTGQTIVNPFDVFF